MASGSTSSSGSLENGQSAPNGVNNVSSLSISSQSDPQTPRVPKRLYSLSQPPSLSAFKTLCSQSTSREIYPHASAVVSNIPVYELPTEADTFADPGFIDALQDEWHHILLSGPGVVVLRNFVPDRKLIEQVNAVFEAIIAAESELLAQGGHGRDKGDHFAASGKNARIWNSFQKHAERDPASFVQYYSSRYLAAMCAAWLGPAYQITAQVNIVRPGGQPQVSHRDYHLGFQTTAACALYPSAMQVATQFLTLQGAVAHTDMTLASGPTRFLPFSQQFEPGYMAFRLREFQEFFDQNWVSCALKMGDAVFFNPALFHAAGENRTPDVHRSANLLQVSSAFGKTMETVDTLAIISRCWDDVRKLYVEERGGGGGGLDKTGLLQNGGVTSRVHAILDAVANGYPFPTNLDRRPPAPGGMAPESEVDILRKGLLEGWDVKKVVAALEVIRTDSMP
ncbi:hypothetical protein FOPE_01813 [Fonsecaea pedrosoi]|nr:hypothetical protein FOPE_01813 [Fonsecaea pedrosoi]